MESTLCQSYSSPSSRFNTTFARSAEHVGLENGFIDESKRGARIPFGTSCTVAVPNSTPPVRNFIVNLCCRRIAGRRRRPINGLHINVGCRYWADVAVNTPVLWSNISVSTHDSLEKARRKLQRSRACPIDITINFPPRPDHSTNVTESVTHAMDLVRPALWRAKSFSLSVPNRPQAHAALLRCQEDAPLLESISIRIFHSMQEELYPTSALPLFKGYTPRLRSCSFTSFNFGWDTQLVSRLKVLQLGGYWNGFSPSMSTLLNILSECPELEEFSLRNLSDAESEPWDERDETSTERICLPKLVKASFYFAGIMRVRTILDCISFPALQTLELCYLDDLTPLLERLKEQSLTSFPLRHLRIETSYFNAVKFVTMLGRIPSLVSLELIDCEDASSQFLKV